MNPSLHQHEHLLTYTFSVLGPNMGARHNQSKTVKTVINNLNESDHSICSVDGCVIDAAGAATVMFF